MYFKAKLAAEIFLCLTESKDSTNCKMQILTTYTQCNIQLFLTVIVAVSKWSQRYFRLKKYKISDFRCNLKLKFLGK